MRGTYHVGMDSVSVEADQVVAAVDLGSHSFHMLVAIANTTTFSVIDRLREPVRLAAGLDADGVIDKDARKRALECLARFGQRLRGLPAANVRTVGTNTLRQAANAEEFMRDAEEALGHPIEVISGAEEARLIYAGVVHGLSPRQTGRLVADIGGGSTEIIAGHFTEPNLMESLPLGCVMLTEHFFPRGRLGEKAWRAALVHAELEIGPYAEAFRHQGWQQAIGSSGTVRAIQKVIAAQGWADYVITREGLRRLGGVLSTAKSASRLKLEGLSERRRLVFPGGVAILSALFEVLGIDAMEVSDAALREGLLLDFVERRGQRDIRTRSVRAMATRFGVDLAQAERIAATAKWLHARLRDGPAPEAAYLEWAALLHELGLAVSHSGHHKHGAYIVENADLMGFSKAEQNLLAALIRAHRGRFQPREFESLPPRLARAAGPLAVALRLAVRLHRNRHDTVLPPLRAEGGASKLNLHFPAGWLDDHPLTAADLADEAATLKAADFDLRFE